MAKISKSLGDLSKLPPEPVQSLLLRVLNARPLLRIVGIASHGEAMSSWFIDLVLRLRQLLPSVDVFPNLDLDFINANMDLNDEVNWYNWVQSAQDMERDA